MTYTEEVGILMPPVATLDELGRRVAEAREAAGLNQVQAAKLYGVSAGTWSGMESGKQGDKWLDLIRLCQVLKTTPNELLGFERPPSASEVHAPSFEDDVMHPNYILDTTTPKSMV